MHPPSDTIKDKIASIIINDDWQDSKKSRYFNYAILSLIALSTLTIFLSTYENIVQKYGFWLHLIDYVIVAIFTVEISLRIWCADLLDKKYQGFGGRLKYCLSFYGLMDILSTYTFYLALIFPISPLTVQLLRTLRLFRIFRYLRAFGVLSRAIRSKKEEMLVSLEFLGIITLILAFVLYFVEHQAQPSVYNNGLTSVIWAFLQYIGDPGKFAENMSPITVTGRIIASIIGILTIAIFAVPAGLIASAFSEIMQEDNEKNEFNDFKKRILKSFRFNYDRQHTKLYYVPRYQALGTILTRKYLSEEQIIKTVGQSDCFHLFNLANAVSPEENPNDKIVVVNFKKNTAYGCCIDRGSKVTIVSTSGVAEPVTSWFAYHIAKIGGFNYVAKEIETDPDNPVSYYWIEDKNNCPHLNQFLSDINRLSNRENAWIFPVLGAVSPKSRPNQFHFCYAPNKGDETYDDPNITIKDIEIFENMYQKFQQSISQHQLGCDKNQYYTTNTSTNIANHLDCQNICTIRIKTSLFVFDTKAILYAKLIADIFNQFFDNDITKSIPPEMRQRDTKNGFGMQGYNDENHV